MAISENNVNFTNRSLVGESDHEILTQWLVHLAAHLLLAIIGSASVCLNIIVLIGFIKNRTIREVPGNLFIMNLAVCDLFSGIVMCFAAVVDWFEYDNENEYLFRIGFIVTSFLGTSCFLSLLTMDRYLKVTMHLRYQSIVTKRRQRAICAVAWLVSIGVGLLPILGWHSPVVTSRTLFKSISGSYIILCFSIGLVPSCCMIYTYSRLYFINMRHRQQITGHSEGRAQVLKTWLVVRTILLLNGVYLVSWLPTGVYLVVGAVKGEDPNKSDFPVFGALCIVSLLNSLANPLIYATKVEEIREFYKRICCCCCRNPQST